MTDRYDELRAALESYDAACAVCPINNPKVTRLSGGECPRCGSTSSGPCWVDVRAAHQFVVSVRALTTKEG